MYFRIIPARAGFTKRMLSVARVARDHPRSRGVYRRSSSVEAPVAGSSPLARGLPHCAAVEAIVAGIIPARAGFTCVPHSQLRTQSDHPRSRGVYQSHSLPAALPRGSSPLARGLLRCPRSPIPVRRDHPRSRGVYSLSPFFHFPPFGSSPLARGLLPDSSPETTPRRIIPARAGFTPR